MEWTRSGEDLFVRIDPNEEIHASLQALADEVGFDAAAITSGIGRTRDNMYGYMNEEGVYQRRPLPMPSELVSLSGISHGLKKGKRLLIFTVAGQMMTTKCMQDICFKRQFMSWPKYTFEYYRRQL